MGIRRRNLGFLLHRAKEAYEDAQETSGKEEYDHSDKCHDLVDEACRKMGVRTDICESNIHARCFEFVFGEREEPPIL